MNFASRELSEKLVAAGCVSESDFVWLCTFPEMDPKKPNYFPWHLYSVEACFYHKGDPHPVLLGQAFLPTDFTGANEQAYKNSCIVWGFEEIEYEVSCTHDFERKIEQSFIYHRHAMIDSCRNGYKDEWDYLEKTGKNMKER